MLNFTALLLLKLTKLSVFPPSKAYLIALQAENLEVENLKCKSCIFFSQTYVEDRAGQTWVALNLPTG